MGIHKQIFIHVSLLLLLASQQTYGQWRTHNLHGSVTTGAEGRRRRFSLVFVDEVGRMAVS